MEAEIKQKIIDDSCRSVGVYPLFFKLFGIKKGRLLSIFQVEINDEKGANRVKNNKRWWVSNTYQELSQKMFCSEATIRRYVKSFREEGVVLVEKLDQEKYNRTNYFAINYTCVDALFKKWEKGQKQKEKKQGKP